MVPEFQANLVKFPNSTKKDASFYKKGLYEVKGDCFSLMSVGDCFSLMKAKVNN